jgi:glycosyltransferase involved in cell wall biosynthesis
MGVVSDGSVMKVGLVIYGDLQTVSGGYLYDRQLVEHLRRQGDQVEIFSQRQRSYAGNLLDNLSTSMIESVIDAGLDILIEDELNHPSLIVPNRRLRRRSNLPIVTVVHHLRWSEDLSRWQRAIARQAEKRYLRSVHGYIFNSETTKKSVQAVAGISEPSVVAVPAGNRLSGDITEAQIRERALRPGPMRVVFLGNVISRKGLHTLLDSLSSLPESDWELAVIGRMDVDEPYTAEIKRRIQAARITENVTLYGPMPDREISRLLRTSDLMAMPSTYEGYGIAYLEGMAFGLPAIATTSGAAGEIITDGECGWLVAPGDVAAITTILTRMRDDRVALTEMSLNARRRFLDHPRWEDSMSRARSFLASMMGATS